MSVRGEGGSPAQGLLPVGEALRIVTGAVSPLGTETIGLECAAGRVLAETVAATGDMPPFDRSMMDGYALRAEDVGEQAGALKQGTPRDRFMTHGHAPAGPDAARAARPVLEVIGFLPAGAPAGGLVVGAGQAVRIMTGAPIPGGADAVQMVEKTEELEEVAGTARRRVRVLAPCRPGENIARRGEDLRRGETILPAGSLIRAAEVGALAAAGRMTLAVHRLPVVSLLSTGDELVEPGEKPLPHQIRNSNGPALLAALAGLGLAPVSLGIARDDAAGLDAKLAGGLSGDLLLVIGGVSVGDKDLVSERLLAAGVEPLFHRIAMKPGKPLFFGRRGACLVFGLPGNPLSALTAFLVFALPAIRKLTGLRPEGLPALRARLEGNVSQKTGRTWYRLARVTAVDGVLVAAPVRSSGSGDLASAARANGFIVVPAQTPAVADGESVSVLLWPGFELH